MAAHQQDEAAADVDGEQGHGDGGDDAPDDEGVPLPLPEDADEVQGVVAEMLQLLAVHGKAAGVEEVDAQLDEGQKEEEVERGHGVDTDLGGDLAEAEGPCEQDDEEGADAYGRVDADDDAQGETPCETAGCDAAAEESQQGTQDSAAEELAYGLGH